VISISGCGKYIIPDWYRTTKPSFVPTIPNPENPKWPTKNCTLMPALSYYKIISMAVCFNKNLISSKPTNKVRPKNEITGQDGTDKGTTLVRKNNKLSEKYLAWKESSTPQKQPAAKVAVSADSCHQRNTEVTIQICFSSLSWLRSLS
jgi:hypothetical protein